MLNKYLKLSVCFVFLFLACKENKDYKLNSCYKVNFSPILIDTIYKHIQKIDKFCTIVFLLDKDIIGNITRINIHTPNDFRILKIDIKFWTEIQGRTIFVITGLEDYFTECIHSTTNMKINTACDNNMLVVYDSSGIISVKENLNDFDNDLRPHKPPAFIQVQ